MAPMRRRIFTLVEPGPGEQESRAAQAYDRAMIVLILASLVPLAFKHPGPNLAALERGAGAVFVVDYLMRWLTADLKIGGNRILAFLRYPFTAMAIVDLLSILPAFLALNDSLRVLRVVRLVRALRVFQVLRLVRYSRHMQIMAEVLRAQRSSLLAVLFLALGYIVVSALVVFNVEPQTFDDFFEALYWATVSLMTVGYGDIYPVTVAGRIVAMAGSLFGVAIVALPAGIVTAGYMEEIERERKEGDVLDGEAEGPAGPDEGAGRRA